MEAKNQEKNLTLVIFTLETCGALATKGYDDIEQIVVKTMVIFKAGKLY